MQIKTEKPKAIIRYYPVMLLILGLIITAVVSTTLLLNKQQVLISTGNETALSEKLTAETDQKEVFTKVSINDAEQIASIKSFFTISGLDTYLIDVDENTQHELTVAKYQDNDGHKKQAIVYLPAQKDQKGKKLAGENMIANFRYEKWLSIAAAIKKHTAENALFISFWDNAQRINLFTGRETWLTLPNKNSYAAGQEQNLWKNIAGDFDQDNRTEQYYRYLLMEKDAGLAAIKNDMPTDQDAYIVSSTDDLSHVQEMARLTGQGLPLETRLFPAREDMHDRISRIKDWAKEGNGTGSYLAQVVSEQTIRVWRITDKAFEDSLLARLLPFSSSIDAPLEQLKLVYQTDWGAFLSIYQLQK